MIEQIFSRMNSIPHDKCLHLIVGLLLFCIALPMAGRWLALAVVAAISICKEIYDYMHCDFHTPDIWDAVATSAGGAFGLFCTFWK